MAGGEELIVPSAYEDPEFVYRMSSSESDAFLRRYVAALPEIEAGFASAVALLDGPVDAFDDESAGLDTLWAWVVRGHRMRTMTPFEDAGVAFRTGYTLEDSSPEGMSREEELVGSGLAALILRLLEAELGFMPLERCTFEREACFNLPVVVGSHVLLPSQLGAAATSSRGPHPTKAEPEFLREYYFERLLELARKPPLIEEGVVNPPLVLFAEDDAEGDLEPGEVMIGFEPPVSESSAVLTSDQHALLVSGLRASGVVVEFTVGDSPSEIIFVTESPRSDVEAIVKGCLREVLTNG